MRTPIGRDSAIDRQTHAEGAIAELKHHGMSRSRCRGTRKAHLQLLVAATAINLKRLLRAHDARAHGQTADQGPDYATITSLIDFLGVILTAIDRLEAVELQRAPRP